MSVVYKPFIADACDQSFLDSQKLMAANFSDKVASSTEFLEWQYLKNPFGRKPAEVTVRCAFPDVAAEPDSTCLNIALRGKRAAHVLAYSFDE